MINWLLGLIAFFYPSKVGGRQLGEVEYIFNSTETLYGENMEVFICIAMLGIKVEII